MSIFTQNLILGIDPGINGGVTLLCAESNGAPSKILFCERMPTKMSSFGQLRGLVGQGGRTTRAKGQGKALINGRLLADLILPYRHSIKLTVIEDVASMPGQGVVSVFTFGQGYGTILGVLEALDLPIVKVKPAVWKSQYNLSSDKKLSLALASKIFPDLARTHFHMVKNDGLAESAILAHYGLRF